MAEGVHVNGLVQSQNGPLLWVARRSTAKLLDPGKLDHIVAGGTPAGNYAPQNQSIWSGLLRAQWHFGSPPTEELRS